MRKTKCDRRWLSRGSWKTGAAAAGLVITLTFPTLAEARQYQGFTCKLQEDLSLECEARGLSEAKRAPEWIVSVDGHQVDRARGWRVVLYPRSGAVNTLAMRAFLGDGELTMVGSWGAAAPGSPSPEQRVASKE